MARKKQKYLDAIDHLDNNFAYFITHILNIGVPKDTNIVPTACVAVEKKDTVTKSKDTNNFSFLFNTNFADNLSVEEYGFVLAHETLHVLLNHLRLARRFPNEAKFNIAADCVINDYLLDCGLESFEGIMKGINNVGYNCAGCTVSQVYDDLPEDIVEQGGIGIQIDDHTWIHMPGDGLRELVDKLSGESPMPVDLQDIKDDINAKSQSKMMGGKLAGKGQSGLVNFIEDTSVNLEWAKLLKKIDPNVFNSWRGEPLRPSWHNRPRKLGAFPDLLMPVKKRNNVSDFGEKKTVFMALDTSGSIGEVTANYFVNLARSVAKTRIHLEVVTFTDGVMELDLENPQFASGGTSFGPIEDWIQTNIMPKYKNKYPNNVIVITDGHAGFYRMPAENVQDRWLWLMTDDGIAPSQMKSQFFGESDLLSKYTKGK